MVQDQRLSSVLSEFARTLITDFPIQGILDHLVGRIIDVLPVDGAGVSLMSPDIAPQFVAASDARALLWERLQADLWEGPCLRAHETGEAVLIPDLRLDSRFPMFAPAAISAGLGAIFAFPLRHGVGHQLGALDLYCTHPTELARDDLVAAQTLADVAAAYVINARSRDQASEISDRFRRSALHDALTGLPNRLLLQERLEHAAMRARRAHTNAAVLFADLDRFKDVNDKYGHHVGDQLLVAVAQRLSQLVRPGDTFARLSGDEFIFLCEDVPSVADAEALAQRIFDAFAQRFVLSPGVDIAMTASIGIAFAGPGVDICRELVVKADMAMYAAKRSGGSTSEVVDLRLGI